MDTCTECTVASGQSRIIGPRPIRGLPPGAPLPSASASGLASDLNIPYLNLGC